MVRDPATEQALADQIMVDPDLANQNEGNAALTVSSDHSLPLPGSRPEAIAAARAEAALLVGGTDKLVPPPPKQALPLHRARFETAAQFADELPGASECSAKLAYSAAWSARLPEALPVYPGGATIDAAGVDSDDCKLRVVTFTTPVATDDVLSFYTARARKARFSIEHAGNERESVLSGGRGAVAFRLALRRDDDGLTEATLATTGG